MFPWLCPWGGCTIICRLMRCASNKVHYDPMVLYVCLHITLPHYHHYADLSESNELLKCLSGSFSLECVSKIKSILSTFFHAIYRAVRLRLTQFSYDDCENMCTLSSYHHQIGSIRSWNDGMCWMSFHIHILNDHKIVLVAPLHVDTD